MKQLKNTARLNIVLQNQQTKLRLRIEVVRRLARFFMERAVRLDRDLDGVISLTLLDDGSMRLLNRRFTGRDEPTDVFSFRYPGADGFPEAPRGECLINAEQALRLGPRYGGVGRELALYIAHGCDHLTGADDADERQRQRMRRRELRWLRDATRQGILHKDIVTP